MPQVSIVLHTQTVRDDIQRSIEPHGDEAQPLCLAFITGCYLETDECAAIR